jgi:hypothetical protein
MRDLALYVLVMEAVGVNYTNNEGLFITVGLSNTGNHVILDPVFPTSFEYTPFEKKLYMYM